MHKVGRRRSNGCNAAPPTCGLPHTALSSAVCNPASGPTAQPSPEHCPRCRQTSGIRCSSSSRRSRACQTAILAATTARTVLANRRSLKDIGAMYTFERADASGGPLHHVEIRLRQEADATAMVEQIMVDSKACEAHCEDNYGSTGSERAMAISLQPAA